MKLFRLNIVSMAIVLVITTIVAVTTVPAAGRSVAIRSDFLPATGKLLDSAEPPSNQPVVGAVGPGADVRVLS